MRLSLNKALLLSLLLPALPGQDAEAPGVVLHRQVAAMGTLLGCRVTAADRATALRASEAAVQAIEGVERRLSTWQRDSELARLNSAPPGQPLVLSSDTMTDLHRAMVWCEASGGAFDPAAGALVDAWGLRGEGRQPTPAEVWLARMAAGPGAFVLGPGTATRVRAGVRIEEGGFAKGLGLDRACEALLAAGAQGAVLDFGGQIATCGQVENLWVPIAHPRDRDRIVASLRLTAGRSMATSGNGERGLVVAGVRIGHLLDPRTGCPAPDFGSVTAVAAEAGLADAAATGLYVLGPERTLAGAAARLGVAALVVEMRGDAVTLRATCGLRHHVRTADGTAVEFVAGTDSFDPREQP